MEGLSQDPSSFVLNQQPMVLGFGMNNVASMGMPPLNPPGSPAASGAPKKAVHVKWAGKTIALGTFPQAEADEKCARAKALTRAWRSTMRPKPSREWVMLELERLQVRVVSGRLGRKEGEKDSSDDSSDSEDEEDKKKGEVDGEGDKKKSKKHKKKKKEDDDEGEGLGDNMDNYSRRDSINASLLNAANSERGGASLLNSLDWGGSDVFAQRRNSPVPMGLSGSGGRNVTRDSLSMVADVANVDDAGFGGQPNRPYVGGASACAYEAARADYYRNQSQKKDRGNGQSSRDSADNKNAGLGDISSGLNLTGSSNFLNPGGGMPQLGLSVNPNQHYEMLKLHHMNLLNEIQETTLMMNLYQQQQLQQQKAAQSTEANMEQQLQQLAQRQQVEAMQQFPNSFGFPQASGNMLGVGVGLGSGLGSGFGSSSNIPSMLLQQQPQFSGMFPDAGGGNRMPRRLSLEQTEDLFSNDLDPQREIEMQERRLQRMKEELARKRDRGDAEGSKNKRPKGEDI